MSRRNSARVYDIPGNKQEVQEERIEKTNPSHSSAHIVRNVRKDEAPGTYSKVIGLVLVALVAFATVVSAKVEATDVRNQINEQQKIVNTLKSENTRMQAEIESKTSRKTVESYAENILGMQKLDKSQCEYISLESGNVIEIPEDEDNFFVKLYNKVSDFLEYLRG